MFHNYFLCSLGLDMFGILFNVSIRVGHVRYIVWCVHWGWTCSVYCLMCPLWLDMFRELFICSTVVTFVCWL